MDEQKIAEMVKAEVSHWFATHGKTTNGYEYEKTFVECWRSAGQKVFQESLGRVPKSKNQRKKLKSSLGEVMIANKHRIGKMANNFRMTSYLQEQVCYQGQKETFEESSETFQRMLGIEVSNKQIQRVSEFYGECVEKNIQAQIAEDAWQSAKPNTEPETTYAMSDGSMLLTKEEGWKEIKLGRVFKAQENITVSENRNQIGQSAYCAHLGNHERFLERFELLLKGVFSIVFIADGAKWFWEWVNIYFPHAIQILDYYHCKDYLCEFARNIYPEESIRKKWIEQQEKLLFKDEVEKVIVHLQSFKNLTGEALAAQEKIIRYYEHNKTRMRYGTYRQKNLLIGSGPIESAHRNVIQKRLKLSGQRWSKSGAQQIANLRVVHKSNQWHKVVELIQEFKKAA